MSGNGSRCDPSCYFQAIITLRFSKCPHLLKLLITFPHLCAWLNHIQTFRPMSFIWLDLMWIFRSIPFPPLDHMEIFRSVSLTLLCLSCHQSINLQMQPGDLRCHFPNPFVSTVSVVLSTLLSMTHSCHLIPFLNFDFKHFILSSPFSAYLFQCDIWFTSSLGLPTPCLHVSPYPGYSIILLYNCFSTVYFSFEYSYIYSVF